MAVRVPDRSRPGGRQRARGGHVGVIDLLHQRGLFNLGNVLGAALGGEVIRLKLAYPWISVGGAGMAAAALRLVLFARFDAPKRSAR